LNSFRASVNGSIGAEYGSNCISGALEVAVVGGYAVLTTALVVEEEDDVDDAGANDDADVGKASLPLPLPLIPLFVTGINAGMTCIAGGCGGGGTIDGSDLTVLYVFIAAALIPEGIPDGMPVCKVPEGRPDCKLDCMLEDVEGLWGTDKLIAELPGNAAPSARLPGAFDITEEGKVNWLEPVAPPPVSKDAPLLLVFATAPVLGPELLLACCGCGCGADGGRGGGGIALLIPSAFTGIVVDGVTVVMVLVLVLVLVAVAAIAIAAVTFTVFTGLGDGKVNDGLPAALAVAALGDIKPFATAASASLTSKSSKSAESERESKSSKKPSSPP
jgi:hypothetical protein